MKLVFYLILKYVVIECIDELEIELELELEIEKEIEKEIKKSGIPLY
jgi:hypothetical protein